MTDLDTGEAGCGPLFASPITAVHVDANSEEMQPIAGQVTPGASPSRRGARGQAQTLGHHEAAAEPGERVAADPDPEPAGLHDVGAVVEMEAELAHRHAERHDARRAWLQRELLEALELAHRTAAARHHG